MDKFYFVGYFGKRVEELHLADIVNVEDVVLVTENLDEKKFRNSFIKQRFETCHSWKKIKDKDPIGIGIWNSFYNLYNYKFEEENNHYVIFWDSAISVYYSEAFFKSLKKKHPNLKLIFYIYDQMNRWYSPRIERMTKYADAVFCTIPENCQQYGFDYFPLVYSEYPLENIENIIESDLYFMGNNSDRDEQLHEIYEYLTQRNVKCDFGIVGVPEDRQRYKDTITYNQNYTMKENLEHSISANCILEIMHHGMNAVTARYPEAIRLNKKILTNNKNVINEKFYNPKYIKLFVEPEDIDVEWLLQREKIEYNYSGEYSPRALINEVKRKLG